MRLCLNCGKETNNPKFCCKSCAAIYNNTHRERKAYRCQKCGKIIYYGYNTKRSMLCDNCNPQKVDWSKVTYGEMKSRRSYQAHSHIRDVARRLYAKSNKPKQCANCGYNKHYEVCHIKPIETHSDDTPVSVINDITNLIALCPNCHWEADHGLLDFKEEWK